MARPLLVDRSMMKRLACAMVIVTSMVGCTGGMKMAGGALLAGAGGLVAYGSATNTSCGYEDDVCAWSGGLLYDADQRVSDPSELGVALGIGMIVAGTLMFAIGGNELGKAQEEDIALSPAPQPVATDGPAPVLPAEPIDGPAETALPAGRVLLERESNRLAVQTSMIARAGQCEAAIATSKRLAEVDRALYDRLATVDEAFARCLAARTH